MVDAQILELFYARSERAITELAQKYGGVCQKIAGRILNNSEDAEECVNDAYLGAWNTIPPQKPDYLPGYLYRIVRNLSLAKYHSNTAAKRNSLYDVALEELEDCIPGGSSVEEEVAGKELAFLLNRFLGTLNRENRILFVRRYWYADSIGELAERFGASSNAISVRLSRVRGKLKKFLEREGYQL